MGTPAARVGDVTSHGTPLSPGPGAATVLIEGRPAWRAGADRHVCPGATGAVAHVGGTVAVGSATVLIGGHPAARAGDLVIEPGGPNPILAGAWTVLIGCCAILVSLWSVGIAGGQATVPGTLSSDLRAHLRDRRFDVVTSIRGLPLGVREALQTLFGSGTLDIAEPGAEFQQTGAGTNSNLPSRRLVAAGCSTTFHCLVYYERGGTPPTRHVVLFHWTPSSTRLEWGGVAPARLATIDDVRKAILAGAINGQARFW